MSVVAPSVTRVTTSTDGLVPWQIAKAHRWAYPLMMLRFEQRRRAGHDLDRRMEARLRRWRQERRRDGLVVDYDPASEEGFTLVPRRPGIDRDLIREPDGDR
jgi:hypothetical protein